MKTKVQKLTATRINVRLKISEARALLSFINDSVCVNEATEADDVASKLADLLSARLNKEETE